MLDDMPFDKTCTMIHISQIIECLFPKLSLHYSNHFVSLTVFKMIGSSDLFKIQDIVFFRISSRETWKKKDKQPQLEQPQLTIKRSSLNKKQSYYQLALASLTTY